MGKAIQVGVKVGNIKEFNKFLAYRQQLGDTYIESRPLKDNMFYFALMTNVNLDQPEAPEDKDPIQPEGEVELNDTPKKP